MVKISNQVVNDLVSPLFWKICAKKSLKYKFWKIYPRSQDNKMGCSSCKCHTATVSRLLGVNFFYSCPDPFRFLRAGRLNVFRATDLWTQTWGTLSPNIAQRWDISVQRIFRTVVTLFVCKCGIEEKMIPIHFLGAWMRGAMMLQSNFTALSIPMFCGRTKKRNRWRESLWYHPLSYLNNNK